MFEKDGKFYADWRDTSGKRLRKSFINRRAALQHEADMKELAHPKQKAQGRRSPKSSAPSTSGSRNPIPITARQNNSSRTAAAQRRKH